ncbi:MAG: hypothetical protein AAGC65_16585 [Mucilaginibacter sp.]|uniref:tetratricopeptide repeat protein n=1 Tax=Mucilaginibacter sp. TaxID=1882438 RepID=UPI0031B1CC26
MKKQLSVLILFVLTIAGARSFGQVKNHYQFAGDSLYKNKDYKGAIESYSKAISIDKNDKAKLAILLDKRSLAYLDSKNYTEVIKDESEAILANPRFGSAYWNRGVAYNGIGEYQHAIDDYTTAMELVKDNKRSLAVLYDNRGTCKRKLNQNKEAVEDFNQSILLNSQKGGPYWHRGIAHENMSEYQLAIDDYTTAMFYYQDNTEDLAILYGNRGFNKRELKQYTSAINDFNTAAKLNPKRRQTYWDRGLTYQYNGDSQLAVTDFNTAIPYYGDNKANQATLYNLIAINEMSQHQNQKALTDVNKAIELNALNGYFYWIRGDIYSQMGKCEPAIDNYTKTREFYKENKEVQAMLLSDKANELYILKQDQQVITDCTSAIALNPNYSRPYFTRGKVYLKRIINKEQAFKDFNKVIELDTSRASVSYIFSQLYIGNSDLAMQKLQEQVLKTVSSDYLLNHYYNIACIYSIMNKPDEANAYLKKAIEAGYSKAFIANDEDFDNIRKTPDYIALMAAGDSK